MNKMAAFFENTSHRTAELWRQLAVLLLTVLGLFPVFKAYFYRPNSLSYAFGGDALVLYYDMVYHLKHGQGTHFQGMNYPYGEYIFLTDAQGALATVLQWFSQHLFDISDYAAGIIHSLNLFLVPLAALLVYLILKALDIRPMVRLPFGVLIAILAPQMLRLKGHFGLAYPFLIPLAMLWFIRKYRNDGKLEWRDLGMLTVLVFFTFNNPYTGFSAAGLLLCAGGISIVWALFTKKNLWAAFVSLGMGGLAVLVPFLFFRINDTATDRVQQQFGFFFYNASLEGLLYPPGSLLHQYLKYKGVGLLDEIQVESWMNIGIVASFFLALLLLRGLVFPFFKNWTKLLPSDFSLLLAGSAAMFLLAANNNIYDWEKSWIETHLGPLLMFKASARIGWSLYFTATIAAVIYLDFLLRKIKWKSFAFTLMVLPVVVWYYEFNEYIGTRYQGVFEGNFFSKDNQELLQSQLDDSQFQPEDYCAILSIPTMEQWSDLMVTNMDWATQFYSLRISALTGLPLLNAQLSRISTGQAAEGIQLNSHPVIQKERLLKLPDHKDILLVVDSEFKSLSVGEQAMVDVSKPVLLDKTFSLYRLPQDSIAALHQRYLNLARNQFEAIGDNSSECLHLSFDDQKNPNYFFGGGAFHVKTGNNLVAEIKLPDQPDSNYLFSAWHRLDYSRFDSGNWRATVLDSLGNPVFVTTISGLDVRDVQDGWIRVDGSIETRSGKSVRLEITCSREIDVDEVMLQPKGKDKTFIRDDKSSTHFLWNGFRVKKTD